MAACEDCSGGAKTPTLDVAFKQRWTRIGFMLLAATVGYNVVEAVVAIWSGERADSVALLGFGLDSIIECAAAGVLLWRLVVEARGADRERVEASEHRARRFVGATFLALAVYVVGQSAWSLWRREAPRESTVGIVLAALSLLIMPGLAWAKIRVARKIGSPALLAEAKETLVCSYLSFALLLGLVANAAGGWWWADPLAALLMVPWLVKEGIEGVKGEACEDD